MSETRPYRPGFLSSLSFRLLLLTVFFVMLAEFLIWAPSVSRYRKVYLEENIVRAHLSMLAIETMPERQVDKALEEALLFHTEAYGIVLDRPDRRLLMVSKEMPPEIDLTVDIRAGSMLGWIGQAFATLAQTRNRIVRVVGMSPKDPTVTIEVLIDEAPMRTAMWAYSGRILNLSVVISLFTAGLVYLSLQLLMVGPMRRITESMTRFRAQPEDAARIIQPSRRTDEVGITERELAVMQDELRQALEQKTRLAALGAAVAKVNHDLRNSLATAVLASDRLSAIDDPEVKSVLPRLLNAIDRAVGLCGQTLNFVSDAEIPLSYSRFNVLDLIQEAGQSVKTATEEIAMLAWETDVAHGTEMEGDREQLYRVLTNLGHNAFEAGARRVRVDAETEDGWIRIDVADDGPGVSADARKTLFQPFAGSVRDGGTGLGLVIVRDIVRAHGGDVFLIDGEDGGAVFRLRLPAAKRAKDDAIAGAADRAGNDEAAPPDTP